MFTPYGVDHSPWGSAVTNPLTGIVLVTPGWNAYQYEGRTIVEHAGAFAGSSVVALIPQEGIGVFVSSGSSYPLESNQMVTALKFTALDLALGLQGSDWIATFASQP
jgi:hypothetical protein